MSNYGCYDALYCIFLLWNPHEFGFFFDRLLWVLHFVALLDWIFPFCNIPLRIDRGIFRMWIFSYMHFDSSIHIRRMIMRRFVRWIGDGGMDSRRVMDGVLGYVPFVDPD